MNLPREDRWMTADEWFAAHLRDLQSSAGRVTRLRREARRGIPATEHAAREFETQTENYRRYLRHEQENNDRQARDEADASLPTGTSSPGDGDMLQPARLRLLPVR